MVPSNILARTFFLRTYHKFLGSAFTLEIGGSQFLVTARHNFTYGEKNEMVDFEIFRDNKFGQIKGMLFLHSNIAVDIALVRLDNPISPILDISLDSTGIYLSQDVYFLGFPYGKFIADESKVNSGYPLPLVKKGILSSLQEVNSDGVRIFYLDAINNPGFSGGPAVCLDMKQPGRPLKVIGVVKVMFRIFVILKVLLVQFNLIRILVLQKYMLYHILMSLN
jgi:S1-C subfamily serine protease